MTIVSRESPPAALTPRSFAPASRLHAQLELQARELHDLRARLGAALAELGALAPTLKAPPLGPVRRSSYRRLSNAAARIPEPRPTWWPGDADTAGPLRPAPGHRCAGLIDDQVPVVAVSFCGVAAEATAAALEQITEQQILRRAFVPLFITDDAGQLHLFRHQGYDAELLPTREALEACPGGIDPDRFLEARLVAIRETWQVGRFVDMGATPLPPVAGSAGLPPSLATLVFYKDYRRYNPYQHLLYAALPRIGAVPGDVELAIAQARLGPTFFHVNWEEALYRGAPDAAAALALVDAFLERLDLLRAAGGQVVWTVHNSEPHDNPFPDAYARLAAGIAARAGLVLVHSRTAAALVAERHGMPDARLLVVPHGGYHALYGDRPKPAAARQALGLPEQGVLFGFVGNVRPYKNLPLLLEAFARLPRGRARLLVAGRQDPPLGLDGLDPAVLQELVIRDEVIEESLLPHHLAACDAIVLPFGRILTSGSLMLALSLEVPVIVPAVPSLLEVVTDGQNGMVFEPGDAAALAGRMSALLDASGRQRVAMRRAAGRTARRCDWGWIGRRVGERLLGLLSAG